MRIVRSVLVPLVCTVVVLGAAATAHADRLASTSFIGKGGTTSFFSDGPNVRVSYRCTSRIRQGLIVISNLQFPFNRRVAIRCDGVPRSVLVRVKLGESGILLLQQTAAFAEFVVFGRPFTCAACFPEGP
jgi:hypothetical protein